MPSTTATFEYEVAPKYGPRVENTAVNHLPPGSHGLVKPAEGREGPHVLFVTVEVESGEDVAHRRERIRVELVEKARVPDAAVTLYA